MRHRFFPNHADFLDHRHDQSFISMMVKTFFRDKLLIGPPALAFNDGFAVYHTYKLFDNRNGGRHANITPYCPFPSFYKKYERMIKNRTVNTSTGMN
jgi:hypothetical protein